MISDLSNPDEKVLNLDAGTVEASVAAAGTTDPVIGPADVTVAEGKTTIVYAWGSLEDDNLKLAVQTISGLHSPPHGVNTSEAGLADRSWTSSLLLVLLLGGGAVVVGRTVQMKAATRRWERRSGAASRSAARRPWRVVGAGGLLAGATGTGCGRT